MNAHCPSISHSTSASVAVRERRCRRHVVDRDQRVLPQANPQPVRAPGERMPALRERLGCRKPSHHPLQSCRVARQIIGERRCRGDIALADDDRAVIAPNRHAEVRVVAGRRQVDALVGSRRRPFHRVRPADEEARRCLPARGHRRGRREKRVGIGVAGDGHG
jgi:hypothetical protein